MIKLSEHKISLRNLHTTIAAIESFNFLIDHYSVDKPGPVYAQFKYVPADHTDVQFDRKIMVKALVEQREKLYDHMESLGIDARN